MSADGSNQLTIHGKRRELADDDIREEYPARRLKVDGESPRVGGSNYANNTAQYGARVIYGNWTRTSSDTNNVTINVNPPTTTPTPAPQASRQDKETGAAKALIELLFFEQMDNRFANIERAHRESCKWFFERDEYKEWRDPELLPQHQGFFWIRGKPGAGKSTLMKVAQIHGEEEFDDDKVISFYFNARAEGDKLQRSTEGMYRSLLVQILQRVPEVSNVLSGRRGLSQRGQDWPLAILKEMFRDAVLALGSTPLTCYVDALDECEDSEARDMVEFFEDLGEEAVEAPVCFRVLLSSRHYPNVEIKKCVRMVLEGQYGHEADIANYIRSKLKIGDSDVATRIHRNIQVRASGIFLWVVLVIRILNKLRSRGQVHVLEDHLKGLPDGLHQLFEEILQRAEDDKDRLLLTLQWLLFSSRPLKREELYFAVVPESSDKGIQNWDPKGPITTGVMDRFILDSSKGLAEVTKGDYPTVQFIHESVRDFLLEKNGLKILDSDLGSNTTALCHDRLKRCCLHYMSCCEPVLLASPTDGMRDHLPSSHRDVEKIQRQTWATHPFLDYALWNIAYHANSAHRDLPQHEFIANFPRTLWQRLYNLTAIWHSNRLSQDVPTVYIFVLLRAHNLVEHLCDNDGNFASADVTYERHRSLLGAAVDRYDDQMVKILLSHGANPNSQAEEDQSCLVLATYNGKKEMMRNLLDAGAMPTPMATKQIIRLAFRHGEIDTLRMLVTHANITRHLLQEGDGSGGDTRDLNEQAIVQLALTGVDGTSALTEAASSGNDELVGLVLACAVGVDSRDSESSKTALHHAAEEGHEQVVRLLLDRGADVNLSDREGETALHNAAGFDHEQVVRLLLDRGADVNLSDKEGETALHTAASYDHEQVVRLLLDHGVADINAENSEGYSALSLASCLCRLPVVRLLLDRGARAECVHRPDPIIGTQKKRNEIERLLLEKRATLLDQNGQPVQPNLETSPQQST